MRLTIVRPDNIVCVDGRCLLVDCSSLDPNIRAVQWDGQSGHIEFDNEGNQTPMWPGTLDDVDEFAAIITAWTLKRDATDAPPPPLPLNLYAKQKRAEKESGGIVFAGIPISTDDRSKLLIMGSRIAAAADPDWTTVWTENEVSYPIDAATMIAISDAVQHHVNTLCFQTYSSVIAQIESGAITTTEQIDAAFA